MNLDQFHLELFWLAVNSFPLRFLSYLLLCVGFIRFIPSVMGEYRKERATKQHALCADCCYCSSFSHDTL